MSPSFCLFLLITANCMLSASFVSTADCDNSEEDYCSTEQQSLSIGKEKHRDKLVESISSADIEGEEKEIENLQLEREKEIKFRKMKIFEDATRLLTRNIRNAMAWMSGADSNVGLVNNLQSNYRFLFFDFSKL